MSSPLVSGGTGRAPAEPAAAAAQRWPCGRELVGDQRPPGWENHHPKALLARGSLRVG